MNKTPIENQKMPALRTCVIQFMQLIAILPILSIYFAINTHAKELEDVVNKEVDTSKNSKSISSGQFLAVPIPVSNPTIGSGLQFALLYLYPEREGDLNPTSGIGGMYTDTKSWVAGLFHDDYLLGDHLRLRAGAVTGELNVHYYGSGNDSYFADRPIEYLLTSDVVMLQGLSRVPKTENLFAGLRMISMLANVEFELGASLPDLPYVKDDTKINSLSLVINYDSRDNNYYPTTGQFVDLSWSRSADNWSSDYNFDRYKFEYDHYSTFGRRKVFATRFYTSEISGDVPFYLLSRLDLRGFSSGRYTDNAAVSAHFEFRHKFTPRWGYITSFEMGCIGESMKDAFSNTVISSVGAGIRWQVSAEKPMHLGVDFGVSGDEEAIYVQVGEKF